MSRVLMAASEVAPFAQTGKLGDFVAALTSALRALGEEVAVVIPRYGSVELKGLRRVHDRVPVFLGPARYDVEIYAARSDSSIYLVDCPPLYARKGLYGEGGVDYPDNHIRFAVLARAALTVARLLFKTDIFHGHDWQAGLLPAYLRTTLAYDPTFLGTRTVFTVHNLAFQGLFPKAAVNEAALDPAVYRPEAMEFYGKLSYLKGGLAYADALTTDSPARARAIQTPDGGLGLDGAFRARAGALTGILNGIDPHEWNPETDPCLPARYSAGDWAGKRACKKHLAAELGLTPGAGDLLLGVVAPSPGERALLAALAGDLVSEPVCLAILGAADPEGADPLLELEAENPGRIALRSGWDEALLHRLIAGADLFYASDSETPGAPKPAHALRYGTVPVVPAAGAWNDTIEDSAGFKFAEPAGLGLGAALREAVRMWTHPEAWNAWILAGMEQDFSWRRTAAAYSGLYRKLLGTA